MCNDGWHKEIGGYIELEHYRGAMLHETGDVRLNCGRNAFAYLIEARDIQKVAFPRFMCDSCDKIMKKYGLSVRYYSVGPDFKPKLSESDTKEWIYLVNFYGQLTDDYIRQIKLRHDRLIVDYAQAYFQMPLRKVDSIYTCRKFFGVPDGAVLYTEARITREPERDESFERMGFLLGRYERTASEFYSAYSANNDIFEREPIKYMSKLTENLLRSMDYGSIRKIRTENFAYLHQRLGKRNRLCLHIPEGAFMYPLYLENGAEIRKILQEKKIYIPVLWPSVLEKCRSDDREYKMAMNILPLPVDQRYGTEDMEYICQSLNEILSKTAMPGRENRGKT